MLHIVTFSMMNLFTPIYSFTPKRYSICFKIMQSEIKTRNSFNSKTKRSEIYFEEQHGALEE